MNPLRYDGHFMRGLNYLGELALLNLLFVLCSLPVITVGASASAMYTITFGISGENFNETCSRFFRAFRNNFRKATIQWLILFSVGALLVTDYFILTRTDFSGRNILSLIFLVVVFIYLPTLTYIFPIQAYFENNIGATFKNAAILSLSNLPQTVLMMFLNFLPILVFFVNIPLFFRLIPVWVLLGFSAPARLNSCFFLKMFRKFNPTDPDASE